MCKKKLISGKMKIFMASLLVGSIASFTAAGVTLYQSGYKLSDYFDFNNLEIDYIKHQINPENRILTTQKDLSNITSLDFDFSNSTAYFSTYSGTTLEISLFSRNSASSVSGISSEKSPFTITSDNNKMTIKPNPDALINANNHHYQFEIKIPNSYANALNINSSSGAIDLNSLKITSLNINSSNAQVFLNGITCDTSKINVTNGDLSTKVLVSKELSIEGTNSSISASELHGNASISSINGYVHCTATNNLNKLNVSANSGSINLNVPTNGNFTIDCSNVNGELVNSISDHMSNSDDSTSPSSFVLGKGENKITLNTVNGDIVISK